MLQEKYGYTREAAQQEVDRRLREYDERVRGAASSQAGENMRHASKTAGASHQEHTGGANRTAEEEGASIVAMASQPISAVGEQMGSLAGVIRDNAPHEGVVGSAATTVAEKLDAAGTYLQEKNLDHVVGDLSGMIRRYPVPSLLVGLGIGYLLALSTRR
jgi:vacuolar-type H+-ATPase subunit H